MLFDLGTLREGIAVWRRALNNVSEISARWDVFENAAREVAGFTAKGLEVTAAADALAELAIDASLIDADRVQKITARAIENVEHVPDEKPKTNGGNGQWHDGPLLQSSAEFVRDFVPPDYLIDGVMQRRFLYALTGKTGSGKTAIVLLIAVSVALGRQLGDYSVERGRVLYFAGENPDDVRMRWIAMSQHMDFDVNTVDVYFIPGRFKISEMRDRIVNELQRIGEISLLIVDTSAAFYEGKEVNSNTEQASHGQLMRTLVGLPGGPAVLVNCHPVKNAQPDNLLPLGAGAFLNEIDGNLTCSIDGPAVEIHWQGKIRGPDFEPMTFEIVGGITHERLIDSKGRKITTVIARPLSEIAKDEMTKAAQSKADRVLLGIADNGRGSVADLCRRIGMVTKKGEPQKATVHRLLKLLVASRLITKEFDSYAVTEKGTKRVAALQAEAEKARETARNEPGLFSTAN